MRPIYAPITRDGGVAARCSKEFTLSVEYTSSPSSAGNSTAEFLADSRTANKAPATQPIPVQPSLSRTLPNQLQPKPNPRHLTQAQPADHYLT